jgi:hypothetical protein
MMVAVALAAVASYGAILWRRAAEYRERADGYADPGEVVEMSFVSPTEVQRYNSARKAWCAELARKYDRAARYPWLPLAPDPPPPQAVADAAPD